MSEAYDLRSNIKGKPGSQGTLFQVKDKGLLNPKQRYPRGYTPERQAEVRDALKDTVIQDRFSEPVRMTPEETAKTGRYVQYPHAEHRVVDTIARSTVPTEHLSGLRVIHDKPAPGDLASYWPAKREMGVTLQGRKLTSTGRSYRDEGEHALIHELGHHADTVHTHATDEQAHGVAASVRWAGRTPERIRSGVAEAVADNYYEKHFRARGRNGKAPTEVHYEKNFGTERLNKEFPGYTDIRPPKTSPLNAHQFSSETLF